MSKKVKVSNDKDINRIVNEYLNKGWQLNVGGRHKKLVTPDKSRFIAINGTPSCPHSVKNFLKDIQRIEKSLGD